MKSFIFGIALLFGMISISNAEIVTVPIPGAPGLSVTVGTGANALPLQDIRTNPNAVNITTWDDNYTNVPLQFNFPMYGQSFNNSWAMTNGMVTFIDPTISGIHGACCQGVNLTTTTNPAWNYSIFGVHTDLYSWNGQNQYYLSRPNDMTYGWYDISQCCSSNGGNSFEIKINSSGLIDTRIAGALVQWNPVTSGFSGDLTKGEYYQYYHGSGWNVTQPLSWSALDGTGANMCVINPLYSPSCPGYETAYLEQQCAISPLYSTSCFGYQQAYHDYQCLVNPLYATTCVGYNTAYHNYQCSLNPLYSTTCEGYQQAYFNKMCNEDGLYDRQCPNYSEAYATQQALNRTPITTVTQNTTNQSTNNVIADPIINNVVTTTSTTTSPAVAAPVVPLVSPSPSTTTSSTTTETKTNTENKPATAEIKQETKTEQKTARQELQERRVESAKREAVAKAQELSKNNDKSQSMEQQVVVQNFLIDALGYNPGFNAYNGIKMYDAQGYKPYDIYKNQVNVDNKKVGVRLFGASDKMHENIVNSQYR